MFPWKDGLGTVIATLLVLLLATGTAAGALAPLPPDQYPDFSDDRQLRELAASLDQSLASLRQVPTATCYPLAGSCLPVQRLIDSALFFQQLLRTEPTPAQLNHEIRRSYHLYRPDRLDQGKDRPAPRMLITGYYQPIFKASLRPQAPYLHPLHGQPRELVVRPDLAKEKKIGRLKGGRLVPFWTRREIETGNLLRGQELAWLRDPFDAFLLHVQGSGILELTDGTVRGVHYAQTNGRPYRSIGKYLVDSGRMDLAEVNMDSLRRYLDQHPGEREQILHHNDSYIFFHWSPPGPAIGNLGRPLTAGRSLAADQQCYPPGALVFLDSRRPVVTEGKEVEWQRMRRFVTVQDTGAALQGPGRVDLFWGSGEAAGSEAGRMKEEGQVYLLILKPELGMGQ